MYKERTQLLDDPSNIFLNDTAKIYNKSYLNTKWTRFDNFVFTKNNF